MKNISNQAFDKEKGTVNGNIWIKELLKNLDQHVAEPTRVKIMEACGEKCPFSHLSDDKLFELKNSSETDSDFLNSLCEHWRLKKEGNQYYVIYDQCYCPLVNENVQGTSKTLCHCTIGNIKRKFAIGLNRNIDVIMESSILAGDKECRFHIQL